MGRESPDVSGFSHEPVLAREVVEWLAPAASLGLPFVDCTLGGGGHAEALMEVGKGVVVIGIDRDDDAIAAATRRLERFGPRLRVSKANFAEIRKVLRADGYEQAAAVLFDLGVSSPQLDRAERGFGFRSDAPLDMRMDRANPVTAADVVNGYTVAELTKVISRFGEERFASRVARAIAHRREKEPFTTASELAEVVKQAIPAATRRTGGHPARRTFQALRIEVNQELESLSRGLPEAIDALCQGGRVAAISYHSLEDRIVKRTFADLAQGCVCPRDLPVCACGRGATLRVLTRKAVTPSEEEKKRNPRSDSARMRVALKLGEAA